MPEGHLVHRLARDQQELVGHVLRVTSPQGRFADGAAAIDGRRLDDVTAKGKHLFHQVDGGHVVHVHLGMQGKFLRFHPVEGEPLRQVRLRLRAEDTAWDLIAPSTCELLTTETAHQLVDDLGPDPIIEGDHTQEAIDGLRRLDPATPIGAALLDQRTIAGAGNVFRAEALVRRHLHPTTPLSGLGDDDLAELWRTLRTLMKQAVDDNEITPKLVYKQPTCQQCEDTATPVETFDLGGRTAYSCATCQPLPNAA